jgi:hypothetical protein
MRVAIDQDKFNATVVELLGMQTPNARDGLIDLMATDDIKIWTNDGRDESWVLTVGGVAFGKVHRSRIEAPPR